MIAAFMVPQKRDFISRDDAKIAAWTILEGMGVSAKHNERLVEEVDAVVDDIPAADVRPVVLCRDCKNNYNTCLNHGINEPMCDFTDRKLREDDFCSRGEKREES